MPFKQIDSILHIAARINALVFLDIQVGFSNVQSEIPLLEQYLKMPNVHLGIDPEFSMHPGKRVGKNVGTFDAADVNFTSNYLSKLVKANNLPAEDTCRAPLDPQHDHQRQKGTCTHPDVSGRDGHGRLGPARSQIRYLPVLGQPGTIRFSSRASSYFIRTISANHVGSPFERDTNDDACAGIGA